MTASRARRPEPSAREPSERSSTKPIARRPARSGIPEYELTAAADRDLLEIARYTSKAWGANLAKRYLASLEAHFRSISRGTAHGRAFLEHRPELLCTLCELHFVFSLQREEKCPLILAVFHERMDLIARLEERLNLGDTPSST